MKGLHFIDFEVFEFDWLCVINNPLEEGGNTETVIINDRDALQSYYDNHKDEIFVGYNIRDYDQFILKAILLGFNPKSVNDKIIIDRMRGFEISDLFNKIELIFFDVMTSMHGLKTLEAYMGHNIHETGVDFNIRRKLTPEEIAETVKYCRNDVNETINVFGKRFSEFEASCSLIQAFGLPLKYIGKTKAQLSAIILNCKRQNRDDEWDLYAVDTVVLNKYGRVRDWFTDKNNHDYSNKLDIIVAGISHKFAWGGLHGARERYHSKGNIWHVDVASFYPTLMIEYDLLSRNVLDKNKYREIRDKRIEFKHSGNPLQKPYKIVLNATYGICKDKYSAAYDPRNANLVCVNGQLLLLDLIEKLEDVEGFELIQSNTDGLIIKVPEMQNELTRSICNEWIERTHCELEFERIEEIWQKDVNNYIFKFAECEENGRKSGKYERKGSYAKENGELDNDMPIINLALFNYFTKGVPVSETIEGCNELIMFQKIVKVSSKYKNGYHNGEKLNDKTYRVFASRSTSDGEIGKQKEDGSTVEKFANTPDRCFIDNSYIVNKKASYKLDKSWYIKTATERIASFVG